MKNTMTGLQDLVLKTAAGAILGVSIMGSAFAQSSSGQPAIVTPQGKNWHKFCGQNPETKVTGCAILTEVRSNTGQFIASAAVRERDNESRKLLLVTLPLGLLLQPGIAIQIDKNKDVKARYSICVANGCFAELAIKDDYITQMKRGNNLVITALNQQGRQITFPISLKGFTASYDGPAIEDGQEQASEQKRQQELQKKAEEYRKKLVERQKQQTEVTE